MRLHIPRLVKIALAVVVCLTVWAWGVLPSRNYLDQRNEVVRLQDELGEVRTANDALTAEIALLQTDEEIERIARLDFGLVYPGEEAYAILPSEEGGDQAGDQAGS